MGDAHVNRGGIMGDMLENKSQQGWCSGADSERLLIVVIASGYRKTAIVTLLRWAGDSASDQPPGKRHRATGSWLLQHSRVTTQTQARCAATGIEPP